jgi:hypothetical protein
VAEEVIIFRNVVGDIHRDDLNRWKKMIAKLGLIADEKIRGKMLAIAISLGEDTTNFYLYEQGTLYQLHIDYLRLKKGDGRIAQAIEWLITTSRLRGEKYTTGKNELWRIVYLNGLVMDEGPYVERKLSPDFDLRITREALMGYIYMTMDTYMEARTGEDRDLEADVLKQLQGYVEELAKVDELLQSQNRS